MAADNFTVHTMSREEVGFAIELAAKEGWNPGLHDAALFHAADPHGFFLGKLDGEPIGCISNVIYDPSFAFLGLYIVRPDFRGRGFGLRLWKAAMDYAGPRNVGLDGVIAQQENYKRFGFRLAYRNIRFQGTRIGGRLTRHHPTRELAAIPFEELERYDRAFFPAPRTPFLRKWVVQPDGQAVGVADCTGNMVGYGVIRTCRTGFKIGPLFADSEPVAETLLSELSEFAGDSPVFLDVPEVNPAAANLAKRCGMEIVFETARMYSREQPSLPFDRIFGVTTFELG